MRRISYFAAISLFVCLFLMLSASQILARDDAATAKRLVSAVTGKHNHPDYYTGKYGFMNDKDLTASPGGPLEKGFYIMSWLVLDPPLTLQSGGGAASITKDLYKDYFGIAKADVSADPVNYPRAGQKSKKQNFTKEDMYWIPINFQDLVDAKQGAMFTSGNEFDWVEWGGQGLNQFHEYLFCLVKWSKDTTVALAAGSDDPEYTYVNGQLICKGTADRDWAADADKGQINVKGGEWVAIFAEVGENGGECGYTLEVKPAPDDHTLDTEGAALAVGPAGKLAATWGSIKVSY